MKRILIFLICAIAFCANAATNTVLTTTTNRVLAISATGAQLVSSNSVTDMRTLLSVPSSASLTTVSNSVTTLQTQLPGYATNYGANLTNAALTGGTVTSQTNTDLTASRALVSDANKKLSSSSVTSTELGYVSGVTSAIQTQIDSKPAATNTALLNGTNTLTGTNRYTGTVIITNAASTISGNGAGLTNIAFAPNQIMFRSLFVTNTTVDSVYATNAATAGYPTNAGEVIYATTVANITVPALLSTSSVVYINWALSRTNVQTGITDAYVYVGTNTNCIYRAASAYGDGTTLPSVMGGMGDRALFLNSGSFTNQVIVANAISPQTNWTGGFVVDTSQPWNLRFALTCRVSGAPNTNTHVELNLMEKIR